MKVHAQHGVSLITGPSQLNSLSGFQHTYLQVSAGRRDMKALQGQRSSNRSLCNVDCIFSPFLSNPYSPSRSPPASLSSRLIFKKRIYRYSTKWIATWGPEVKVSFQGTDHRNPGEFPSNLLGYKTLVKPWSCS